MNDGTQYTQAMTYDSMGRNTSLVDFAGNTKTLHYDPAGRLDLETLPGGTTSNYTYDDAGRLTELRNLNRHKSALNFSRYTLDEVGNRVTREDTLGVRSFTYDKTYQLTGVSYPLANVVETDTFHMASGITQTATWTYDEMGNRTSYSATYTGGTSYSQSYEHNNSNEMTKDGSVSQGFDKNGNMTSRGDESLAWDWRNRLIGSTKPGRDAWAASYDYNNRIATRTLGTTATRMLYDDQGHLLTETNASGQPIRMYSYDGIGLVAVHTQDGSDLNTEYALFDGLGSTVGMVNDLGKVTGQQVYSEWGVEGYPHGIEQPFRYTGRWGGFTDEAVGDVLNWNRWYAPVLGRWDSRDPIGLFGGLNTYVMSANNLVVFFDPTGRSLKDWNGFPSREEHRDRNKNNKCPKKAPQNGKDCLGRSYDKDRDLSDKLGHGFAALIGMAGKYRFSDGSECDYNKNGDLVTGGESYNYGANSHSWGHIWKDWLPDKVYGPNYTPALTETIDCDKKCEAKK